MSEKFNKNENTDNSLRLSSTRKSIDIINFKKEILKKLSNLRKLLKNKIKK